jgi:SAM-dependent methyltransferase
MATTEDPKEFYRWYAEHYGRVYDWRPDSLIARWRRLLPILKQNGVKSILDAACGVGRDSMELARLGFQVTGVDLSQEMIFAAQAEAAKEDLKIPFLVGDISCLSGVLNGKTYDCVLCIGNSLTHAASIQQMAHWVGNLRTALKPDRLLLLECQIVDNVQPGESDPGLQVLRVLPREDGTEVFLRRTCYRWQENRIEKLFIRLVLSSDDAIAEEHATALQMVRKSEVQEMLRDAGLTDAQTYADMKRSSFVEGTSDGVFVIATRQDNSRTTNGCT